MALSLQTLADLRTLLTTAKSELVLDNESTAALDSLGLPTEGKLVDLSSNFDTLESNLRLEDWSKWHDYWATAQDEIWAAMEAQLPSFDRLLADDRTKVLLKRVMRTLALRRCKSKAGV